MHTHWAHSVCQPPAQCSANCFSFTTSQACIATLSTDSRFYILKKPTYLFCGIGVCPSMWVKSETCCQLCPSTMWDPGTNSGGQAWYPPCGTRELTQAARLGGVYTCLAISPNFSYWKCKILLVSSTSLALTILLPLPCWCSLSFRCRCCIVNVSFGTRHLMHSVISGY